MRRLTMAEMAARYKLTQEELRDYLVKHADEFPSSAHSEKTRVFNSDSISYLDKIFDVHEEVEDDEDDEDDEEGEKSQLINTLKEEIENLKDSLTHKDRDLAEMEDKFLKYQDSAAAGTKHLVDKLRNENDILKKQLSNFDQFKNEQLQEKDARITELKDLVSELEEMVNTNVSLTDEKLKYELKSKQLSQKILELNKSISSKDDEKKSLEVEITRLKENKVMLENKITELQGTLNGMIKTIAGVIGDAKLRLEGGDKTITTIPEPEHEHPVHELVSKVDKDEYVETTKSNGMVNIEDNYKSDEHRQDGDVEGGDATTPWSPSSF